ncbi:transglutaminase-like domain-containing protein [Microbulbifer thermotolerans]|nr:transglutaminase-like domain-containing protein [Microbulbifer thermotolerans]MCX2835887.1 transglutaminase-like domain-containing protein [Microbulbifer thermotolerans]WKT59641.1 transglutaminase-like domain-containing protein [Microbulbifer thermotolerans]
MAVKKEGVRILGSESIAGVDSKEIMLSPLSHRVRIKHFFGYVFLVALLATVLAGIGWLYIHWHKRDSIYEIEKTIRYSFLVKNKTAEYLESASLKVFAPVPRNSYQLMETITANKPFEIQLDQSGNQSLIFHLKGVSPYASEVISITAEMRLAGNPQPFTLETEPLLAVEPNIEVNDPDIRELAGKLGGNIDSIAAWIYKNVKDVGYIAEDRGARYAITKLRGDCTEFASAFVALARVSGIPSRMVAGFMMEDSGRLQAENYHNWSEYQTGNTWSVADVQNNTIDFGYGKYISFYSFDRYSRLGNSHRFLSFDERLDVQML